MGDGPADLARLTAEGVGGFGVTSTSSASSADLVIALGSNSSGDLGNVLTTDRARHTILFEFL